MGLKVFKFGGASIKDANSVKNVASILKRLSDQKILVVISAMGKITNSLEKLTDAFLFKQEDLPTIVNEIKKYHFDIIEKLFPNISNPVYADIHAVFAELEKYVRHTPSNLQAKEYDQLVSFGEIISSKIVNAYLQESGLISTWIDAREVIKTDSTYREGQVDWEKTTQLSTALLKGEGISLTQGFIGRTPDNFTTTLGREGSDYTAAILAYCTDAESVTIWKDVPGVMNADPKWFDGTKLIQQMSYQDAIELSYYGATVIHPKTIKPLQNKNIPLYVRSFNHPEEKGTIINDKGSSLPIPCFIFKIDQLLLSISPKDFSFIAEENFSDIFKTFAEHGVKINVMQNSAISFSVCMDNDKRKTPELIKTLQKKFRVLYNENVELITIRYYNQFTIDRVCIGKKVFMEHKSRYTVQLVAKNI